MTQSAEVRPLDVDGVAAVAVGTALWAVALVGTLIVRDRLAESGNEWWIWVCLSGFVLGLIGLPYVIRRRNAYRSAAGSGAGSSEAGSSEAGSSEAGSSADSESSPSD